MTPEEITEKVITLCKDHEGFQGVTIKSETKFSTMWGWDKTRTTYVISFNPNVRGNIVVSYWKGIEKGMLETLKGHLAEPTEALLSELNRIPQL